MSPTGWESNERLVLGWLFIEFPGFTEVIDDYFESDEAYAAYQVHLAVDPLSGDPMPGCGGIRKDRWKDPRRGKGKRGGLRILYLHIPEVRVIALLDIYDKNEADDIPPKMKPRIAAVAAKTRAELAKRFGKGLKP